MVLAYPVLRHGPGLSSIAPWLIQHCVLPYPVLCPGLSVPVFSWLFRHLLTPGPGVSELAFVFLGASDRVVCPGLDAAAVSVRIPVSSAKITEFFNFAWVMFNQRIVNRLL